jgi:MFS transporter, PPP family, 3-phenylpropionic acid transporter
MALVEGSAIMPAVWIVTGLSTADEKRSFSCRLATFYAALFVVIGASMAYFPSWLISKSFGPAEIGWIAAAPTLLRLFLTPAIAFFADRTGGHARVIIGLSVVLVVALLLMAGRSAFWTILILNAVVQLSLQAMMPLGETIAMRGVKYGGLDYGRMRLWGSVSFVVATYSCGLVVERLGIGFVVWFLLFGGVSVFMSGIMLPRGTGTLRANAESSIGTAAVNLPVSMQAEFMATVRLITSPVMLWFLLATGAVQAGHALFYTFGVVHWRALGLSSAWIGSLWAISIAVEVLLFSFSGVVIKRLGVWNLVALGALASVIRWTMMAFDPSLPTLVLLQVLHAATFAGTHIGAMHFIREHVPEAQAGMAQALNVTFTTGVMMGLGQVLAGQTYDRFGALSYLGMAAVAGMGLAVCVIQMRRSVEREATIPK